MDPSRKEDNMGREKGQCDSALDALMPPDLSCPCSSVIKKKMERPIINHNVETMIVEMTNQKPSFPCVVQETGP